MTNNITSIFKLATPKEIRDGVKWYSNALYRAKEMGT